MKAIITKVEPLTIQQDGSRLLDVAFDIVEGEEVIDAKHYGFPLDATAEQIREEVTQYVTNYEREALARIANAERDAEDQKLSDVVDEVVGLELEAGDK